MNIAPSPWSFEVLASNPAVWQVDIAGSADPSVWNVVGTVTGGFDFLEFLGNAPAGDLYGLTDIPLDERGAGYVVTDVQEAPVGFPIFVPEPRSLLLLTGAAVWPLMWKAAARRMR